MAAEAFGQDPFDLPKRWTPRQLAAALCWLHEVAPNRPSRGDHYLMQIAAEVRRGHVKKPRSVRLQHMLLKFKAAGERRPADPKEAAKASKARWLSFMTAPVVEVKADGSP